MSEIPALGGALSVQVEIADIVIPKKRMRALRDVKALADSMAKVGLLNPVVITKDRRLVAGLHRLAAAKSLGWTKIQATEIAASDLQCQLAEIDENLIRNELTVLERSEHFARRKQIYEALHPETRQGGDRKSVAAGSKRNDFGLIQPLGSSGPPAAIKASVPTFTADTAKKIGVSNRTVEQEVKIAKSISPETKAAIRGTVIEDRKADLLKIARMEPEEQKQVAAKIAGGAKSVKDARKEIHREAKAPSPAQMKVAANKWKVLHAECKTIDIPDASVDCIVTDPPYPKEFLPCYSDLGKTAARVLRPGGSCIVMVGQSYLPELIARLGEHLTYQWMCAYLTPGGQAVQLWDRKVNTFWKPLLWFVKPPFDAKEWQGDVVGSSTNENDKRFHDWGQSESGMAAIVNRFTFPGQTILDPFVGGGTTGVVAAKLGRNFIGCDMDEKQVAIAVSRMTAAIGVSA